MSAIALVATIALAMLYVGGGLALAPMKAWMPTRTCQGSLYRVTA